jgi:lipopolysaccharide biosynthesis protein
MKSICFFSSYYNGENIPVYVKFYLTELTKQFSEVVLVTNEKEFSGSDTLFLKDSKIQAMKVANEGFDFGMYYKAFQNYDATNYGRIGLVNDSCVLFGKLTDFFNWVDKENPDYCGFTDSYLFGYHLQSYFIVINKNAIPLATQYFKNHGIVNDLGEVIQVYEIGLSKYLIDKEMTIKAFYPIPLKGEYNYALLKAKKLINEGFPFVKKKIITRHYAFERWWSMVVIGFDPFPSNYIKLIRSKYSVAANMFEELYISKGVIGDLKFQVISILAIMWGVVRGKRKL